ncbi:MAG: hypothetical protein ACYST0_04275 [Planctomycetota bacterium]|jgi:hypothetical protein
MKALTSLTRKIVPVVIAAAFATAWLPAQADYQAFVSKFSQAMKFNDENGMDRAVRDNPRWVTYHYEAVYRQWIRDRSSLERRQVLNAVQASFKRVFATETLDRIGQYFDVLSAERTGMLDKAEQDWFSVQNFWTRVRTKKHRPEMEKVIDQSMTLARKFEELSHPLKAANVWATIYTYIAELPDPSLADQRDGIYVITRFIENRKLWSWTKDPYYNTWANWLKTAKIMLEQAAKEEEKRKKAGFEEQTTGPEAFIIPGSKDEVGEFAFAALKTPPRDCFFRGGPVPALWMSSGLGAAESGPSQLHWYRASDLFLVRPGAAKFGITWDGGTAALDKNPWQKIDAPNKISTKPSGFYLDKHKKRRYAMWFFTGGDQEAVVGLTTNLSPQRDSCLVYYRSAASWTTTLNGVKVTFLDDNCDGKILCEDPFEFGLKERTLGFGNDEVAVPCYDSMIIGKGKPGPYSSWVKLGDKWFHLRELSKGGAVGARPVHTDFFKVGTLQMSWAGGKKARPELLVMRGKHAFASAAFDISGGKPVEVPVGKYTITYGRVVQGKGSRAIVAQILQGHSEPVEVKEGENTLVELGAPFKIDFEHSRDKGFVVVDSVKFKIKGRSGEHYAKISGAVATPEVLYAKAEDGKGARVVGEFIPITNGDMLNKAAETMKENGIRIGGFEVAFFAIAKGARDYSTRVRFLPKFPDGHVGLRQKKHKLFGKLDPNFK